MKKKYRQSQIDAKTPLVDKSSKTGPESNKKVKEKGSISRHDLKSESDRDEVEPLCKQLSFLIEYLLMFFIKHTTKYLG